MEKHGDQSRQSSPRSHNEEIDHRQKDEPDKDFVGAVEEVHDDENCPQTYAQQRCDEWRISCLNEKEEESGVCASGEDDDGAGDGECKGLLVGEDEEDESEGDDEQGEEECEEEHEFS